MDIYYSKAEIGKEREMAYGLLKTAFANKGLDLDKFEIKRQKHGKPYVENIDFDFNLSHTKGFAICAIGGTVGVDCEKIREVKQSVINRVCSNEEIENLEKTPDKTSEFMRLWTFKEAFTKMLGTGFRYPFKNTTYYNAMYLHPNIKIYQRKIDDIIICAIEQNGNTVTIN